MTPARHRCRIAIAAAACALFTAPASAQDADAWDANRGRATRASLEAVLDRYERAAQSSAYSEELLAEARDQAARLRDRLERGDFRPGDRIFVRVEEHTALSDTFTVAADNVISIPQIGEVRLAGALRSELEPRLAEEVARIIRDPVVRARSLMRVVLTGAVARPGFYVLDAQLPLSDVFMLAGGPSGDARLTAARVERGDDMLLSGDDMDEALTSGRTLDELGLRDGDRIHVPRPRSAFSAARDIALIIPATLGLVGLLF